MINKMQKTTSIITAAMSFAAMGMNTKAIGAERLEAIEGTMNSIHNYKNGTYVFDGYRSDEYDSAGYYFNGDEDIKIEEVDFEISSYGNKYVSFGNDEILFNLDTGTIEEETDEDKKIFMEEKFRLSKVNKAEKYESIDTPFLNFVKKLNNTFYGDEWFEYRVAGNKENSGKTFLTYLSDNGQHLDASEGLGIIVHEKQEDGSVEKIELSKTKDLSTYNYKIEEQKTVFSTKDYIYRLIKIKSTKEDSDNEVTAYLQKISKEQGKLKKGVYQPKSMISYKLNEDDSIMNILENDEEDNYIFFDVDNSLYIGYFDGDDLSIEKYNLKKTKESRLDTRIVEFDDDITYEDVKAITQDSNGNLWVVSKGKVSKFVNDDLEVRYLVDRSLNNISVYNDENLSLWNTENNIYSIVSNKEVIIDDVTSDNSMDKSEIEETVQGWSKNNEGDVVFVDGEGNYHTGWLKDNDKWYYLNENGVMHTGWIKNNGSWYYLQEDGTMKTGWLKDNDNWYYMNENGMMHIGWLKDSDGKWYFLKENGSMAYNETVNGYNLGSDGAWIN